MWLSKTLSVLFLCMSFTEANDSPLLSRLLSELPAPLNSIANKPENEVQVLYVQIEKTEEGPKFIEHGWHLNKETYFYPASTVKFPVALFALEKVANLAGPRLNRETTMSMPPYDGEPSSVAEDVRRIFLVSDNAAFNRLFAFVGEEKCQQRLRALGLTDTQIVHALGLKHMTFANPIRFLDSKGELLHSESLSLMSSPAGGSGKTLRKGVGYLDSGVLVNEPMDFSHKNVFPLHEQHLLVREVYFPSEEGLRLTPADREFVKKTMGQFPRECAATTDAAIREEPDTYVKNFLGWAKQPIRDTLRCYNKSGQAYGYMIDNAYIVDEDHDIAFFLSTAIHVNANQIYNDNVYEYDTIGEPFMIALGKAVYDYERSRK